MTRFNRTEALLQSAWQCLAGFDFEVRFTKSDKTKVLKQQLMLPMQPMPTAQGGNNGGFNDITNVVNFPANEQRICHSSQWQYLHRGRMSQLDSQPDAPSPTTYSSGGWLWKHLQWIHENMNHGSTSPTMLGYAPEVAKTHWECISFEGIPWFLPLDGRANETVACFHGWWNWQCNVLSPGN